MYVSVLHRDTGGRDLYEAHRVQWSPHSPEALLYTREEGIVTISRANIAGLFVMGEKGSTIEAIPPMNRDKAKVPAKSEAATAVPGNRIADPS